MSINNEFNNLIFQENDLTKKFEILDTNVSNLNECNVICFTEYHDKLDELKLINDMVVSLYQKNKDIVLVEGWEGELSEEIKEWVFSKYPNFNTEMEIRGWDSNEILYGNSRTEIAIRRLEWFDQHIQSLNKKPYLTIKDLTELAKFAPDKIKKLSIQLEEYNSIEAKNDVIKKMLNQIRLELQDEQNNAVFGEDKVQREIKLAQAILKARDEGKRVYVIAGRQHLFFNPSGREFKAPAVSIARQGSHLVRFALEKQKYVILHPCS